MSDRDGYFGRILWIDLTAGTIENIALSDEIYSNYLGGYGLGVKILFDRMKPGQDPLGPENILGFIPGLLTGSFAPFTGRYMVVGKSPLTGSWGDANSGGYFGPAIRKCGVDGIFFKGISQYPTYLLSDGNTHQLVDAGELWGTDAIETETLLRQKHGRHAQVAAIGPAGERLLLISSIMNNKGRAAARSGLGAVMGSKKLKAIVLTGREKLPLYNAGNLKKITRDYHHYINKKPGYLDRKAPEWSPYIARIMRKLRLPMMKATASMWINILKTAGTSIGNATSSESGDSPVKNWGGIGYIDFPWRKARNINSRQFLKFKTKAYGCATCPVRCGAMLSIPELNIKETHRPEYETACMFGTLLLNDDHLSIIEINDMCNRAGMDTISTGACIGFAIECFENGIITRKDTGGLALRWGDTDAIKKLLIQMINRDGFGDVLADGVKRAAERIGKGAEKFAIHANGQELPAHDPKFMPSLSLTYATDPTPGRHTAASIDFIDQFSGSEEFIHGLSLPKGRKKDPVKKAQAQRLTVAIKQVVNALGYCEFAVYCGYMPVLETLETITGWQWSLDKLIITGLRIQNLRLAFTLREGINPMHTELPDRVIGNPPQEKGPHRGVTVDTGRLKAEYYKVMGWDPVTGVPKKETLQQLGLNFVDLIDCVN